MALKNVGKALAILRQQMGLSQAELAESCGIGRSQLSRYEAGRVAISLVVLEKILGRLNVAPDDFFRFLGSLDPASAPPRRRIPDRVDDRLLADAFRNLHTAVDELRQVVERAIDPAVRFARLIDDAAASKGPAGDAADS
jgi:transcriptional regulator with XRE-family HTH domain